MKKLIQRLVLFCIILFGIACTQNKMIKPSGIFRTPVEMFGAFDRINVEGISTKATTLEESLRIFEQYLPPEPDVDAEESDVPRTVFRENIDINNLPENVSRVGGAKFFKEIFGETFFEGAGQSPERNLELLAFSSRFFFLDIYQENCIRLRKSKIPPILIVEKYEEAEDCKKSGIRIGYMHGENGGETVVVYKSAFGDNVNSWELVTEWGIEMSDIGIGAAAVLIERTITKKK